MGRLRVKPAGRRDERPDDSLSLSEPGENELATRVVRGLGWKLVSQIALQGTRVVVGVILAHLLTPHDFGLAAMALVVSGFVIPFADIGLGAALVQRPTLTEEDRSTAFWSSVGSGLVFTVIGVAGSPLIAHFYGDSRVGPLVAVLSLGFLITSLGSTQRSLLHRAMNFKSLELRYVIGVLVGGTVAIVVAAHGYGPWAFVLQDVTVGVVSTVLLWVVVPWRPKFIFSLASLRDLGGFGTRVLGGVFFINLSRNTDNLLIGRFIGATPLGLYAFAYNMMLAPLTRLVGPIQQVVFPAFSRLQSDERRLAEIWTRANRVIAALSVPLLTFVIVEAPDLVPLVFGQRWHAAARIVQVLCWVGILQCVLLLNDSLLQARDAVNTFFRFTAASFAVNLVAFVVGLHWGVFGVAVAFAAANSLLAVVYTTIIARVLRMTLDTVVAPFIGIGIAVIGMASFTLVCRMTLEHAGIAPWPRLIAAALVSAASYALLVALQAPSVVADARALLSRRALPPTSESNNGAIALPAITGNADGT